MKTKVKNKEETSLPRQPRSPSAYNIVNSPLNDLIFEVQNRSIINQRKHRSSGLEVRVGRRVHCCDCDSVYGNHGKPCKENHVKCVQDSSRCALLGLLIRDGWSGERLTAEERMDDVDPDVPALNHYGYGTSKPEHSVFAGAVHGGSGDGHPRCLDVRALEIVNKIGISFLPMEPITTIALRSEGDTLLTSK